MTDRIQQFIDSHQLLRREDTHLVGVSGGADSICLLMVLKSLGYKVEAVHCNFKLRGEESDRDEQFVADVCQKNSIALHLVHFDTLLYAKTHKVSIEMAARQLRYDYFETLRNDLGASSICVAHHKDDSVETILMNLVRGTGINGLTGIKPRNGHIVRPLLCVSREEIEAWLKTEGQQFITDSSNLVPDVTRNKIRLEVIPALKHISTSASDNILTTARRVNEALLVYDNAIKTALSRIETGGRIDIALLMAQPSPESMLFEWLSPMRFSPATIEAIAQALPVLTSGRLWHSPTHTLTVNQGQLVAGMRTHEQLRPLRMPEAGTYVYAHNERFSISCHEGKVILKERDTACLDASKAEFPLTVRPCQPGDRFCPFGMRGSKSVSDYLTDRKFSRLEKDRQLVVTDARGNIVWLVDQRPDNRYSVSDGTTNTIIIAHSNE